MSRFLLPMNGGGMGELASRGRGWGRGQGPGLSQMLVTKVPSFSLFPDPSLPSFPLPVPTPLAPAPNRPPAPLRPPGRWPWRCGTCGPSSCAAPACSSGSPRNVSSWRGLGASLRRRAGLLRLLPPHFLRASDPPSSPFLSLSWSGQEVPRALGTLRGQGGRRGVREHHGQGTEARAG